MRQLFVLILVFIGSLNIVEAHNPLSALYYLEVKEHMSVLTINLSQDGLHKALKKQYPQKDLEAMFDKEYKKLAVNYIKENFELSINGRDIKLLEGGIKLGSHQTDLKFVISTLPNEFDTMDVSIKAFSENGQHQTIFSLFLNGTTSKVILNQNNAYEMSVDLENDAMVERRSKGFNKSYLWSLLLIPIVLLGKRCFTKFI